MKTTLPLLLGLCAVGAAPLAYSAAADAKPATTVDAKAVSRGDRNFVEKAAKAGTAEVAISQAALPHLTNTQAKEFASMMVADHTGANRELTALAGRKGITLPADKVDTDKWTKAKDKNYDAEYIDKMVSDHDDAVKLFTDASKKSDDPELQAFAAKTLPTLQAHYAKAKAIKDALKR